MQGIDFREQKAQETTLALVFPEGLREKVLFRPQARGNVQLMNDKGEAYHSHNPFKLIALDCLEEYLTTENPDKLIEAVMHDHAILHGTPIVDHESWDPKTMVGDEIVDLTTLSMAHIGTYNDDLKRVTPATVVWSTINYWRSFLTFKRNAAYATETGKFLENCFLRLGGALIPSIVPVADGAFTEEERKYREMKSA
ncbi:MAG: hypothetical protein P8J38_01070 [Thermodesulfobacteriota bacteirum]|jgi:hypothetical protein|nr:hypothetical protein [Thermodesulfobacteriota bacterium]